MTSISGKYALESLHTASIRQIALFCERTVTLSAEQLTIRENNAFRKAAAAMNELLELQEQAAKEGKQ